MNSLKIFSWIMIVFGLFGIVLPLAYLSWGSVLDNSIQVNKDYKTVQYVTNEYPTKIITQQFTNEVVKERLVFGNATDCIEIISQDGRWIKCQ